MADRPRGTLNIGAPGYRVTTLFKTSRILHGFARTAKHTAPTKTSH